MTNEGLEDLINYINTNREKIFEFITVDISKKEIVFYVKSFVLNCKIDNTNNFNNFYFIKNENIFIGLVQDGGSDLHWYLKKEYRGHGFMFNSLKEYIIPHIFTTREEIHITMNEFDTPDTYEKSKKLAEKIGFLMTEESGEFKSKLLKNNSSWPWRESKYILKKS
jgi:RimJ/RimL family protein N-acetyltransferase